jgi:pterin-4a-carbinolamine dehydratase
MTQKKLSVLMEAYLATPGRPSEPPIEAQERAPMPIVPSQRWSVDDRTRLRKTFCFDDISQRNSFVAQLMDLEMLCGHSAEVTVTEDRVKIRVWTHSSDSLTELDKEYAAAADSIFRDIVCPHPSIYLGNTVG